jgi:hypothetical protein
MKKKCSQEHLTPQKGGVREPKPLKKYLQRKKRESG